MTGYLHGKACKHAVSCRSEMVMLWLAQRMCGYHIKPSTQTKHASLHRAGVHVYSLLPGRPKLSLQQWAAGVC